MLLEMIGPEATHSTLKTGRRNDADGPIRKPVKTQSAWTGPSTKSWPLPATVPTCAQTRSGKRTPTEPTPKPVPTACSYSLEGSLLAPGFPVRHPVCRGGGTSGWDPSCQEDGSSGTRLRRKATGTFLGFSFPFRCWFGCFYLEGPPCC